jgi:hypothetical protein
MTDHEDHDPAAFLEVDPSGDGVGVTMYSNLTATPGWARAVLEHRFDRTLADADGRFTVAIAVVPDPWGTDFLHGPVPAPRTGTVIRMEEPVRAWGWELINFWGVVGTEPHRTVSAARIRRKGLGTPPGDAEPVAYATGLALVLSDHSRPPLLLPGEADPSRYGSVDSALADLAEAAVSGCRRCGHPIEPRRCEHILQARMTVSLFNVWFADQVRAHGWPRAAIDAASTCRLVAERAAAHPDVRFRAQCRELADQRLRAGDLDPNHHAIIGGPDRQ